MDNSFLIGTAPFCNPDPQQCYATPGYRPAGRETANCWTGSKIKCVWDNSVWKNSGLYNQLRREGAVPDRKPQFRWFGNATFCMPDECDIYRDWLVPVARDLCGDGTCCVSGEKILGMFPMTNRQRSIFDNGRKACGFV